MAPYIALESGEFDLEARSKGPNNLSDRHLSDLSRLRCPFMATKQTSQTELSMLLPCCFSHWYASWRWAISWRNHHGPKAKLNGPVVLHVIKIDIIKVSSVLFLGMYKGKGLL